MKKIGLVGVGMLGNAVGMHLLEAGYRVTAWNRTRKKTDAIKKNGAVIVETPRQVAENSEMVITVVKDANALKRVSFYKDGIIFGKHDGLIVCDMSTINPLESEIIFENFARDGISMLDTPVMGGPNVAVTGDLVMMAAGNQEVFDSCCDVLNTIAKQVFFLGKNGTAHAMKLAMNLQITMLALSLSEGITLARGANINPKIFLEILNSTYFKTGMSENKAFNMIQDRFDATFTLANLNKDIKTISETSKSFGLNLPMFEKAKEVYNNAVLEGFGDLDYTGILAYIKKINERD